FRRMRSRILSFEEGQYATKLSFLKGQLAERTGLEPATPGVTGRYSNQLNYRSDFGGANPIGRPVRCPRRQSRPGSRLAHREGLRRVCDLRQSQQGVGRASVTRGSARAAPASTRRAAER